MAHPERHDVLAWPARICQLDGVELGPLPEEHVRALIAAGLLGPDDQVEAGGTWRPLVDVPELAGALRRRAQHRAVVEALFDPVAAEASGLGDVLEQLWAGAGLVDGREVEVEVPLLQSVDVPRIRAEAPVIALSSATGSLEVREAPNPAAPRPEAVGLDPLSVDLEPVEDEVEVAAPAPEPVEAAAPEPVEAAAPTPEPRAPVDRIEPDAPAKAPSRSAQSFEAEWVDVDALGTCDIDAPDRETLLRAGLRHLAARAYTEAQLTFGLLSSDEHDGFAAAALAYVRFMRTKDDGERREALRDIEAWTESMPKERVLRLFAARMAHLLEDDASARVHLSAVKPEDVQIAELARMREELAAHLKRTAPAAPPPTTRSHTLPARAPGPWLARPAAGIAVVVAALAGFGVLGHMWGVGAEELTFGVRSEAFWARRLALGLLGFALIYLAFWRSGATPPRGERTIPALAAAIALGAPLGVLMPPPLLDSPVVAALGLGLVHVAAEELLFRGYVDRLLAQSMSGWLGPAVISGQLYGLYQLSYAGLFEGGLPVVGLAAAVLAGTSYAVLYQRTRSPMVAFVCHAVAQTTLIALAG